MSPFNILIISLAVAFPLAVAAQTFDPWKGVTTPAQAPKQKTDNKAGKTKSSPQSADTLTLETTKGKIVIRLRSDLAPNHVARLKQLTNDGFYNNAPFHRVIDSFMAQTGDGQRGDGTGGSKYPNLKAEFSRVPFRRGIVGMARRGDSNDSANSQFFIMYADQSSLNNQYTVVGEVVSGMEVADKLRRGEPVQNPDRITRAVVGQ